MILRLIAVARFDLPQAVILPGQHVPACEQELAGPVALITI
jgi:hypothetical protein